MELVLLDTLWELGVIPDEEHALLTPEVRERIKEITMTEVDKREKEETKHDVRALVQLIQETIPRPFQLRRWVHLAATSFDIRDTGSILAFKRAFLEVTLPTIDKLIAILADKVEEYAEVRQIGRTHGQHALPITVGFWLATILGRLLNCRARLLITCSDLRGKFSGAVGAYNAQIGLLDESIEEFVLDKLGLLPAEISTQILPPELLADFLHAHVLLSACLAQLGRDCRHLQRSEIQEIREKFEEEQVGSSTMPHKRNPISFENTEGMFINVKNEYGKVLDTLISEHQRDLVGSSPSREFAGIIVFVQYQLERMVKVISKMEIDEKAIKQNFNQNAHLILAEPLYLALQMAGYKGDAHHLVNKTLVPKATPEKPLISVLEELAKEDPELKEVVNRIPEKIWSLLYRPEDYIGLAVEKSHAIAMKARSIK
ncbi:adenylosuccinate lyase [Patescibacteria group bacterium]|nr:adenylosuccinate lyase [Patescibacteria group bacterium]